MPRILLCVLAFAKPLEAIEEYWQHDRSWDSAETNADNT